MPGGLTQLQYYGYQDIAITGNPEITYFKSIYRKHSNFSMESIEQTFNGTPGFGQTVTLTVNRNGDLIHKAYLRVVLPEVIPTSGKNFRWVNWIGHVLIKSVSLEIGGNLIDKQYGEWMHIWNSLTQKMGQQSSYARLVGNVPKLIQPSTSTKPETILYIPLQFFFCQNPGLALPMIALQNQDVKLHFTFRNKNECYWSENGTESNVGDFTASLYMDYIFLDTEERALFARKSHQYLINQIQTSGDESITTTSAQINLNFTNNCKELVWVVQKDDHIDRTKMQTVGGPQWFNFTDRVDTTNFSGSTTPSLGYGIGSPAFVATNPLLNMPYSLGSAVGNDGILSGSNRQVANSFQNSNTNDIDLDSLTFNNMFGNGNTTNPVGFSADLPVFDNGENPVSLAKITFNNQDRITERDGLYFNYVQPLQHHTNWGGVGLNLYSFALEPEKIEPTGSVNFSAIDKTTLVLTLTDRTVKDETETLGSANSTTAKCRVYSNNYNILRIQGGMSALAYGY